MAVYTCPTCGEKMERDLSLFMDHTDRHIIDEVKRLHPNWITPDGYCPKCLEHFKHAMGNPGTTAAAETMESTNLDAAGVRQRLLLGLLGFGSAAALWVWLATRGAARVERLFLFPLFFIGALGIFQAQKKVCVVIAQKQTEAMRRRATGILVMSVLFSALLTAIGYFR